MRQESGLRQQVDAAFDRAGVVRTAAFELGTSDAVVRFVGLGFGAALVPLSATSGRSGVAVLRLTDALAQHPVDLVHRQPEPSAPSARGIPGTVDRVMARVRAAAGAGCGQPAARASAAMASWLADFTTSRAGCGARAKASRRA